NLEAIVTGDSYELEEEARTAGMSRIDPPLLDGEPSSDEQEAEQLAKRVRDR
ncbi:MAG: hypothetical protein IIB09_08170, partial [Bacteroidetes bacterium]|nr:hypothetical protein [Bacteroidota bacterium]